MKWIRQAHHRRKDSPAWKNRFPLTLAGTLGGLVTLAGWIVLAGPGMRLDQSAAPAPTGLGAKGQARLISIEPLPVAEGEFCEWVPAHSAVAQGGEQSRTASARETLGAALRQEQTSRQASGAAG